MSREQVAERMNRLHEVEWDRCTTWRWEGYEDEGVSAFGWIARQDGRFDFATLDVWPNGEVLVMTSSAEFSHEFDRRLRGTDTGHQDCQRVEDVFGDLVPRKVELT